MLKKISLKVFIGLFIFSVIITGKTYGYEEQIEILGLNGVYGGSGYRDDEAYEKAKGLANSFLFGYAPDEIVSIQSFTQTREDLNIYFLGENGDISLYTIMDRNMGATEVYNKEFNERENYDGNTSTLGEANQESFGYQYQWGNNYGFKPCVTPGCTEFPGGEEISPEEHKLYYHIRENFLNGNFANNVRNRGAILIVDYPHEIGCDIPGSLDYPQSEIVRIQQHENMRGGHGDSAISNGNSKINRYGFSNGGRNCNYPNTGDIIINSRTSSRKGPCPNGYHIPSFSEWNRIVDKWKIARNRSEIGDKTTEDIESFYNNSWGAKLASDLLLPPAGARATSGSEYLQGVAGRYRSSSPTYFGNDLGYLRDYVGNSSRYLAFNQLHLYGYTSSTQCAGSCLGYNYDFNSRTDGLPIRCIKDSTTNNSTELIKIYPNGGSNAIIAIDGNRISALSSPTREGCNFKGRYSNNNKVNEGDEIFSDLYAKWEGNNCEDITTKQSNCSGLPDDAQWINSKFTQTWSGISWTPSSHENTYTSDNNIECSFQCNTNYTRDSNSEKCITNTQKSDCSGLPNNAQWINSKFTQIWDGVSRNPSSHENTYTSDGNIECSFQCSTNHSRNSSSKSCEYNGSSGGGGGGGGDSSKNSNHIYLSTNKKSPSTNQFINLAIETDDDYSGKLYFSAKYKSSSSSNRTNISNLISSSYFSSYSDEWEDGYYKMTSNDDGEVTLRNLVKFKKSGYYRIYIEDKYGNNNYIQFNINSNSSDNNPYLEISASPSNPDTYEWIKLTIKTDDDYTGKIKFSKLQYKSDSSSSWSTISNTSSTYISEYSDEWEDGYYKMTSNDDGEVTLKKVIKFKKSGHYKILVEDTDGNEDDVEINVGSSSSSSNKNNNINISISPNNPYTYERINLTIKTSEDYNDKLYFNAEYRNPSSNDWYSISNISTTYFSDYSDDWKNGYYKMESSDNNKVTLNNLIKFKIYGFYKIYIEDAYGNSNIFQFYVNSGTTQGYENTNNGSNSSDSIENKINNLINGGTNNENFSNKELENGETEAVKNATYISRSCKPYTIYYVAPLNAYTSPNLKKTEYFVNVDYLIRYIDSKNPKNSECNIGNGWISSPYTDNYTGTDHVTAPNGKVYFIDEQKGSFTSNQLTAAKSFQTIDEIKNYIKNHNPLPKIN